MILSGKENRANVANVVIENSQNEKLLGIFFDRKPSFGYRIENVCLKASLAFVAPYTDLSKKKIFDECFLMNSRFSHCHLVWICHSRALTDKINRLYEHCLRLIYTRNNWLLQNFWKIMILSQYVLDICKLSPLTCPRTWMEVLLKLWRRFSEFIKKNGYNLRQQNTFKRHIVKSVCNGTETVLRNGKLPLQTS